MVGTRHAVSERQEQSGLGSRVPTTLDVIKCENGKIKRWFYHTPSALLVSLSQVDKEGENGNWRTFYFLGLLRLLR